MSYFMVGFAFPSLPDYIVSNEKAVLMSVQCAAFYAFTNVPILADLLWTQSCLFIPARV